MDRVLTSGVEISMDTPPLNIFSRGSILSYRMWHTRSLTLPMALTLLQGVSCSFFHRVQQKLGSQAQLRQQGLNTAWDIEDLVRLGKKVKVHSAVIIIRICCYDSHCIECTSLSTPSVFVFRLVRTLLPGVLWMRQTLYSVRTIILWIH